MSRKVLPFLFLSLMLCSQLLPVRSAEAGDQPFVGEIAWVPFNVIPKGWARCDGQLMPISPYTALFSLLGTQYGGDGKSTFALPDMQGRVLINAGQGAGLADYYQGESGGEPRLMEAMPAATRPGEIDVKRR